MKKRIESDFYQTPYCLTDEFVKAHLINRWEVDATIADFCSGDLAIQRVLHRYQYKTFSRDLIRTGNNFFDVDEEFEYGIMNPPFRLFNKWVEHCFKVFTKEFALLAPTTYQQGIGRFNAKGTGIFQNEDWLLSHVYTFNRYPMLSKELRKDGKIETGMQALSWYVWTKLDRKYVNYTTLSFLDIDQYVLRKKDIV